MDQAKIQNAKMQQTSKVFRINKKILHLICMLKGTHLHKSSRLLAELVVMFELDSDGLVTVQACQLHICGVAHEEGAVEVCRSDT